MVVGVVLVTTQSFVRRTGDHEKYLSGKAWKEAEIKGEWKKIRRKEKTKYKIEKQRN
jgi:hypothetical protein